MFDPYKALAGLESLVDLARDNADTRTKRLSTILRQCRPLLGNPQFQSILLKLVGDKEDVEVAKAIQKSLRPSASWGPVCLRVLLVQVSPGGLLILAMLRVHRLHASIVAGVAILLDFAPGTKQFLFAFAAMIC